MGIWGWPTGAAVTVGLAAAGFSVGAGVVGLGVGGLSVGVGVVGFGVAGFAVGAGVVGLGVVGFAIGGAVAGVGAGVVALGVGGGVGGGVGCDWQAAAASPAAMTSAPRIMGIRWFKFNSFLAVVVEIKTEGRSVFRVVAVWPAGGSRGYDQGGM